MSRRTRAAKVHRCRGCGAVADASRRCADCVHADERARTGFRPVVLGRRGLQELVALPSGAHYITTSRGLRRVPTPTPVTKPEAPELEAPAPAGESES